MGRWGCGCGWDGLDGAALGIELPGKAKEKEKETNKPLASITVCHLLIPDQTAPFLPSLPVALSSDSELPRWTFA